MKGAPLGKAGPPFSFTTNAGMRRLELAFGSRIPLGAAAVLHADVEVDPVVVELGRARALETVVQFF
jgi:hypothetical protein